MTRVSKFNDSCIPYLEVAHLDDEHVSEGVCQGEVGLVEVHRVVRGRQMGHRSRPRRLEHVTVLFRRHDVGLGEYGRRRGGRRGVAKLPPQPFKKIQTSYVYRGRHMCKSPKVFQNPSTQLREKGCQKSHEA